MHLDHSAGICIWCCHADCLRLAWLQRSGRKCFDSADFVLQQQGRLSTVVSGDLSTPEQPIETLSPKLSPTQPPPRRMSNLGDAD